MQITEKKKQTKKQTKQKNKTPQKINKPNVPGRENGHYKRLNTEYSWLFVQGTGRRLVWRKRE